MKIAEFRPFSIVVGGRLIEYQRPVVMGILNITPDSFYDGGRYAESEAMLRRAHELIDDGADIIDLGAVSSRPGATLLPPDEEASRLSNAVRILRAEMPEVVLSVDTCFSRPAAAALDAGADIINDIGGGTLDENMFALVAERQVPYVMMHTRGLPSQMQQHTSYDDLMAELVQFFSARLDRLYAMGAKDVWLDPGFGFAKTTEQNHDLLHRLDELCHLFREPMLVGISRKSMIYRPLGITPNEALAGTIALNTIALERGAQVLRVHDPLPARQTINLLFDINKQ